MAIDHAILVDVLHRLSGAARLDGDGGDRGGGGNGGCGDGYGGGSSQNTRNVDEYSSAQNNSGKRNEEEDNWLDG